MISASLIANPLNVANSTGLTLYNPENAAEMLKSMKNKNVSREDKILARVEYEKQQSMSK